jgi:hypothetical protein
MAPLIRNDSRPDGWCAWGWFDILAVGQPSPTLWWANSMCEHLFIRLYYIRADGRSTHIYIVVVDRGHLFGVRRNAKWRCLFSFYYLFLSPIYSLSSIYIHTRSSLSLHHRPEERLIVELRSCVKWALTALLRFDRAKPSASPPLCVCVCASETNVMH